MQTLLNAKTWADIFREMVSPLKCSVQTAGSMNPLLSISSKREDQQFWRFFLQRNCRLDPRKDESVIFGRSLLPSALIKNTVWMWRTRAEHRVLPFIIPDSWFSVAGDDIDSPCPLHHCWWHYGMFTCGRNRFCVMLAVFRGWNTGNTIKKTKQKTPIY